MAKTPINRIRKSTLHATSIRCEPLGINLRYERI